MNRLDRVSAGLQPVVAEVFEDAIVERGHLVARAHLRRQAKREVPGVFVGVALCAVGIRRIGHQRVEGLVAGSREPPQPVPDDPAAHAGFVGGEVLDLVALSQPPSHELRREGARLPRAVGIHGAARAAERVAAPARDQLLPHPSSRYVGPGAARLDGDLLVVLDVRIRLSRAVTAHPLKLHAVQQHRGL